MNEQKNSRNDNTAVFVDMLQRVQGQPPHDFRGWIAATEGNPAMGDFMDHDGEDEPGKHEPEFKQRCNRQGDHGERCR